jgi:hypothetical protein
MVSIIEPALSYIKNEEQAENEPATDNGKTTADASKGVENKKPTALEHLKEAERRWQEVWEKLAGLDKKLLPRAQTAKEEADSKKKVADKESEAKQKAFVEAETALQEAISRNEADTIRKYFKEAKNKAQTANKEAEIKAQEAATALTEAEGDLNEVQNKVIPEVKNFVTEQRKIGLGVLLSNTNADGLISLVEQDQTANKDANEAG